MNWLTTVPELLHHCLDLGVEGLDVITIAFLACSSSEGHCGSRL
jgi:hypothetical protein